MSLSCVWLTLFQVEAIDKTGAILDERFQQAFCTRLSLTPIHPTFLSYKFYNSERREHTGILASCMEAAQVSRAKSRHNCL